MIPDGYAAYEEKRLVEIAGFSSAGFVYATDVVVGKRLAGAPV